MKIFYNPVWFLFVVMFIQPVNGFLFSVYPAWIPTGLMVAQMTYLVKIAVKVNWESIP